MEIKNFNVVLTWYEIIQAYKTNNDYNALSFLVLEGWEFNASL